METAFDYVARFWDENRSIPPDVDKAQLEEILDEADAESEAFREAVLAAIEKAR